MSQVAKLMKGISNAIRITDGQDNIIVTGASALEITSQELFKGFDKF